MNNVFFRCTLAFVALALLVGCGGGSRYQLAERPASDAIPVRVVVTDFIDNRPTETRTVTTARAAPFTFFNGWHFSRPDQVYSGHIESFPRLMARMLADALEESNFVESAQHFPPDSLPERGTYDILVRGTLNSTTARGRTYFYSLVFPLGFQVSDVLWYLGAPKFTRHYEMDIELQLFNGYTNEPLGAPIQVTDKTSSKIFGQYANERRLRDFQRKVVASWNDFMAQADQRYPAASDRFWANLRTEGQEFLAAQAREEERIRRGAPPVFTFIAPANNTQVRMPNVDLQWSVTAPNGLRAVEVALNGEAIELGYHSPNLQDERTAPRSVAAQQTPVALALGSNLLTATVADHRENETSAELTLMRLPRALTPETRFALVIGAGTPQVQASATALTQALRDPMIGQFRSADIQTLTSATVDPDEIRRAVTSFAPRPRAGELAIIYIAAPALAESAAIGTSASSLPLADLIDTLQRNLATEEVILVLDLDWDRADGAANVFGMLGEAPRQWAIASSSIAPAPTVSEGDATLFGATLVELLREGRGGSNMTIELLFDTLFEEVEGRSGGQLVGDVTGRYNPNIIMAQYE